MKRFFKFTFLKLTLALIIAILPLAGNLLYSRSIVLENETLKTEASWGVKALYYTSEILFVPFDLVKGLFTMLGEKYFGTSFYFGKGLSLIFIYLPYFLIYLAYCYLLSCLISLLINKIR